MLKTNSVGIKAFGKKHKVSGSEDAYLMNPDHLVYGVFDGVSSAPNGAKASNETSKIIGDHCDEMKDPERARVQIEKALYEANERLGDYGDGRLTTATILKLVQDGEVAHAVFANVGDGQIYWHDEIENWAEELVGLNNALRSEKSLGGGITNTVGIDADGFGLKLRDSPADHYAGCRRDSNFYTEVLQRELSRFVLATDGVAPILRDYNPRTDEPWPSRESFCEAVSLKYSPKQVVENLYRRTILVENPDLYLRKSVPSGHTNDDVTSVVVDVCLAA